jgi:hypothetical protein
MSVFNGLQPSARQRLIVLWCTRRPAAVSAPATRRPLGSRMESQTACTSRGVTGSGRFMLCDGVRWVRPLFGQRRLLPRLPAGSGDELRGLDRVPGSHETTNPAPAITCRRGAKIGAARANIVFVFNLRA